MDLPGPGGQPRTVVVQQQRPSLGYFLFLSFLFYLMNQQQVQTGNLIRQAGDGDQRAAQVYKQHRHQLLLREARREGIARWLGIANETSGGRGEWLASSYYPDVANGTAPASQPVNSTEDNAADHREAYKISTFTPRTDGELAPVHRLVTDLFSSPPTTTSSSEPTPPQLYLQNLTGFTKGHWDRLPFSYADLGLNETWTEQVEREPVRKADPPGPESLPEAADADALTAHVDGEEPDKLERRQADATPAPAESTEPEILTYNRTFQRGTFPWTSDLATAPRSESHRSTFNLRSVQTSATGPVLPLGSEHDDGELLRLKDFSSSGWADWEKLGPVVYVGGKLTLHAPPRTSSAEEEVTELDVEAVHFLDSGRVYGYATPDFARARIVETISLPLMSSTAASSSASPNLTATAIGHAMLKEFDTRLERDVRRLADADMVEPPSEPSSGTGGGGGGSAGQGTVDSDAEIVPRCIFSMYGALSPLPSSYTPGAYAEWYSDLFHPTGARVREPPPSTFSAILASPNCGLVLSIPRAKVVPTQQLWNAAAVSGAGLVLVEALILLLQVRQLERVQGRPGTIANVSHYGVVGMLFVDAYTFVTLLTLGVVFDSRASLALLASAFMSLLSSLLFGTRYIAMIREATPDRPAATPAPAAADSTAIPLLDDSQGGAMAAMPEWARSRLNTWTVRRTRRVLGFGSVIGFGLYLLNGYGWTALILWIIYSNWIPQIMLNVWRGTARQSLADEYVIGMTIARIAPPLYFWAYDGNCLLVPTSPKVWYLAAYYIGQAFILVLQNRIASPQHQQNRFFLRLSTLGSGGARFFISPQLAKWLELPTLSSWDYHPRTLPPSILADLRGDIETGKLSPGAQPSSATEPDCPICLSSIHVFPTKEEQAAGEDDAVRMAFAVTPCAHLVHTECLEQWVLVRSICPVCRASLPPLGG